MQWLAGVLVTGVVIFELAFLAALSVVDIDRLIPGRRPVPTETPQPAGPVRPAGPSAFEQRMQELEREIEAQKARLNENALPPDDEAVPVG
jgi:hypothetical protein